MAVEELESLRWHNKICLQCDGDGCSRELWFWYSDCSVIHEREQITDSSRHGVMWRSLETITKMPRGKRGFHGRHLTMVTLISRIWIFRTLELHQLKRIAVLAVTLDCCKLTYESESNCQIERKKKTSDESSGNLWWVKSISLVNCLYINALKSQ